jgi:hypothetical protein
MDAPPQTLEACLAAIHAAEEAVAHAALALANTREELLRCAAVSVPCEHAPHPLPAPDDDANYNLTLTQAAWHAGLRSDNGMKDVIRRHGDRLGRKILGRWRVSSKTLDEVLSTGSVLAISSVSSVAGSQALPPSSA